MDTPQLPPRPPGTAMVHFHVHAGLSEVRQYALDQGWFDQGFTAIGVDWLELHFTTDGWATTRTLKSTDVPCPIVDGWYFLPRVEVGANVAFAVHAGLTSRRPDDPDHGMFRGRGDLWFNNDGANYSQTAR